MALRPLQAEVEVEEPQRVAVALVLQRAPAQQALRVQARLPAAALREPRQAVALLEQELVPEPGQVPGRVQWPGQSLRVPPLNESLRNRLCSCCHRFLVSA